jgi:hypothetical protein
VAGVASGSTVVDVATELVVVVSLTGAGPAAHAGASAPTIDELTRASDPAPTPSVRCHVMFMRSPL